MDCLSALGKGLGSASKHVGDGAFGNLQAEQALQHLGQARIAYHLAAVQIGDERDDAGADGEPGGMSAGGLAVTVFLQQAQSPQCKLIRVVVGLIGGIST